MIEFKPFTQGMNLLAGDGAKADGALRDASNVVVRTTGEVETRPSMSPLMLGDFLALHVEGDTLYTATAEAWFRVETDLSLTRLADIEGTRAAFAAVPGGVLLYTDAGYWLLTDGTVRRVDRPKLAPPALSAIDGGLLPGAYKVAVAAVAPDGSEGPLSWASRIDLPNGGGIAVASAAVPLRVYLSHPDGGDLWRVAEATGTVALRTADYGQQAAALAEEAMPCGDYATVYQGRLWALLGTTLFFSQPYRYGVMDAYAGFLLLPGAGAGMVPLDGPLYVGTSAGMFLLTSADTDKAELLHVHPAPVVPGSMLRVQGELLRGAVKEPPQKNVACWFTGEGHLAGLPDGTVVPLSPGKLALLPGAGDSATVALAGENYVATFLDAPAAYAAQCVFSKPVV